MRKTLKTVKRTATPKTAKAKTRKAGTTAGRKMAKTTAGPTKRAKRAAPPPKDNVIRRLFEMREARRKQAAEEAQKNGHGNNWASGPGTDTRHLGFSRFAGPRRRAA